MSRAPKVVPGQARTCPLCRATILESASVCPGCRHHLRFDANAGPQAWETFSPLTVEGTIRHPATGGAWEYSVVLSILDEQGEELARQVVGVGAVKPAEQRTFALSVEVFTPVAAEAAKTG